MTNTATKNNDRLKAAASEITDLWWAKPEEGGVAKSAVIEAILRKHLGPDATCVPVESITHVRFGKKGWGTNIQFRNGAILRFTNKLSPARAKAAAIKQYQDLLAAGFTEVEIVAQSADETVAYRGQA